MKRKIKKIFEYTPGEIRGLTVFLIVLILIYSAPYIKEYFFPQSLNISIQSLQPQIDGIENYKKEHPFYSAGEGLSKAKLATKLFIFDPNNLPIQDWIKLGLSAKQATIIKNYESKGGKFRTKDDVKKMFVISAEKFTELEPYIKISEKLTISYPEENKFTKTEYPKIKKEIVIVEINGADSVTLNTINGIGPSFSSRIIKYRNRLGGFININQLKEVWGLDSTKFEQIKNQIRIDNDNIIKLKINECTFEDLKTFPYLTYKQSNAIIAYRKQHGNFKNPADLSKIVLLNSETIQKIAPYLKF